jgi:hypothetical protein
VIVRTVLWQGDEQVQLPPKDLLQGVANYSKHPLLPVTATILAAPDAASGSAAAIMSLPDHQAIEFAAMAKSCCHCNKAEDREVRNDLCGSWQGCGLGQPHARIGRISCLV